MMTFKNVVPINTVSVFSSVLAIVLLTGGVWDPFLSWANNTTEPNNLERLIDDPSVVTLTLTQAVFQALENNLDITISRQTRDIRVTDILFEQAKFDPTVEFTGRYDRSVVPLNRPIFGFGGVTAGSEPDNISQTDTRVSLGLSQKLPTGANYDLTLDSNRNSVAGSTSFLFNPSYTSNMLLNLTQPLLRDFGADVNRTAIAIARKGVEVEQFTFVSQVLDVVAQVEQAYWELAFARENEQVFRSALRAAQVLLASNQAKVDAGVLAEVEVLQAKTGVANRVGEVLIAQKTVRDQEDQLRQLLSPTEEQLRQNLTIVPVDPPISDPGSIRMNRAVESALQQRPEILQGQKNIESRELNKQFSRNQLLPRLEFQSVLGLIGLGKDAGDALDREGSGKFYNAGAGLVLSYPLGNRSAESQYRRRQLETTQAQTTLLNLRRQVIVTTKEAVRRVETDGKRIATTRTARTLADRQLQAEQERLNLGLSTTRQVLEFQRDLARAQVNEFRAIVDYNQSLANLNRMTADSISHYHITLQ